jgi:hypothetical protein
MILHLMRLPACLCVCVCVCAQESLAMIGVMPIVVQFASPACGTAVRYQVSATLLLGLCQRNKLLPFIHRFGNLYTSSQLLSAFVCMLASLSLASRPRSNRCHFELRFNYCCLQVALFVEEMCVVSPDVSTVSIQMFLACRGVQVGTASHTSDTTPCCL